MMRRRMPFVPALLVLFAAIAPRPADAQSAAQIVQTAIDRYTSRLEGIRSYTVVQDIMGMETTTYYSRVEGSHPPVFDSKVIVAGQDLSKLTPSQEEQARSPNLYEYYPELAKRASLKGSASVDGHDTYVVEVTDLSGIPIWQQSASEGQGFEPKSMTIYMDKEQYLARRVRIEGNAEMNGKKSDVTMVMDMGDYRDVQGLLYPFHMSMNMHGMENSMTPEERAEAQQSLDQLQKQMKDMPEAQRKMMEKMMGGQMENLKKMLAGGGMQMEVVVKDVKVNTPPPLGS